jgi:hypothetical protein
MIVSALPLIRVGGKPDFEREWRGRRLSRALLTIQSLDAPDTSSNTGTP